VPILLYVPNLMGYARIALAFGGLAFQQQPQSSYATRSVVVWVTAAVLDLFDGMAARHLNQTSTFGILLDVVADNVLRTCVWIAVIIEASSSASKDDAEETTLSTDWTSSVPITTATIVVTASSLLLCLEWLTLVATQLLVSSSVSEAEARSDDKQQHWKTKAAGESDGEGGTEEPWLVRTYFRNNFRNPLGCLGIFGLFGSGMFAYGSHHSELRRRIPAFDIWMYAAFLGRAISACIELHFCWKYVDSVLQKDYREREGRKKDKGS